MERAATNRADARRRRRLCEGKRILLAREEVVYMWEVQVGVREDVVERAMLRGSSWSSSRRGGCVKRYAVVGMLVGFLDELILFVYN